MYLAFGELSSSWWGLETGSGDTSHSCWAGRLALQPKVRPKEQWGWVPWLGGHGHQPLHTHRCNLAWIHELPSLSVLIINLDGSRLLKNLKRLASLSP